MRQNSETSLCDEIRFNPHLPLPPRRHLQVEAPEVAVWRLQEAVPEAVCSLEQAVVVECYWEREAAAERLREREVVVAVPVQVPVGGLLVEGQPEVEELEVAASVGLAFDAQKALEEPAVVGRAVAVLVHPAAAAGAVVEATKQVLALAVEAGVVTLPKMSRYRRRQ